MWFWGELSSPASGRSPQGGKHGPGPAESGQCPPGSTESLAPNGTGDGAAGADSLLRSPVPAGAVPRLAAGLPAGSQTCWEHFLTKSTRVSAHGVIFAWGRRALLQRQPLEVSGAAPHAKPQEEKAGRHQQLSRATSSPAPLKTPNQGFVRAKSGLLARGRY